MTSEEKIRKWLNGELSDSERKEFESTEEFARMRKLLDAVQSFKAPDYDPDSEYKKLSDNIFREKPSISLFESINPLLKIAAILIIALTIGYFSWLRFYPSSDNEQWITEETDVYLPDSSIVTLNAGSGIRYSDYRWRRERTVELAGEAFFRVKEGSDFSVKTQQGTVSVLGTEFTVKDWDNYYQVNCFTGSVKVRVKDNSLILMPKDAFRILNGKEETFRFSGSNGPGWLKGESSFRSVPLLYVLDELERQYDMPVETRNVNTDQLFTGSFSHKDLEIALKSITLPLNLQYGINDDKIVITIEGK